MTSYSLIDPNHFPSEPSRAFFIANNRDLSKELVEALGISDADLLVQFNQPLFFGLFAMRKCFKIHFNNPNHLGSCWGFDESGKPTFDLLGQKYSELAFMATAETPQRIRDYFCAATQFPLRRILNIDNEIAEFSESNPYPKAKYPSVGFNAISFFAVENQRRINTGRHPMELCLVGFTGKYSRGGWDGHDFLFEQRVYSGIRYVKMV